MERVRRRKSKVPSAVEGIQQIQKQRNTPKLASDAYNENLFMLESRQNYARQVTGTPIKKLIAEEMFKETDVKRQSPSVVARLMGLDGLPSPRLADRRSLENCQHKNGSIGSQRKGQLCEGRSNRRSSVEHQEFKDVFEDLEASHVTNRRYSSKWDVNSKLMEQDLTLCQQRFMDANHLSADETFIGSKEFHDTLDMIDFKKDSLLKFHQQPDLLFVKHLCDLQRSPSSSLCSHRAVVKPSNSAKSESNDKRWNSERKISSKHDIGSLQSHSYGSNSAYDFLKSSKIRSEGNQEGNTIPTRIVVLKPNLGKTGNANSYYFRENADFSSVGNGETRSWAKRDTYDDMGFSRPGSREAREIAKEITRQMKESFHHRQTNMPHSGFRGYAGDESSYGTAGSDSASESELVTLTSENSFVWNNQLKSSLSCSIESSVSEEATKRLSERWKMTHRCQEVGLANRSNTLGEMLAISDKEIMLPHSGVSLGLYESSDGFASCYGAAGWDGPCGISSRDGWKDGCFRNSSRSRSLPPSAPTKSYKSCAQCEALVEETYVMPKERMSRSKSKAVKRNFNQKDLSSKIIKSSGRRSQPSCRTGTTRIDSPTGGHFSHIPMDIGLTKKDPPEKQSVFYQTLANGVTCTSSIIDVLVDPEQENIITSSGSSAEKLTTFMSANGNSPALHEGNSAPQFRELSPGSSEGGSVPLMCPGPEPESSESCKEADHPSPVSVLEVPFTEDASSGSECFERVSAGLHELRLQLQLLKMESEACAEVPTPISHDTNMKQESAVIFEEKGITIAESWESSYLVDVLMVSGFNDASLHMFMATGQSPECPLGSWAFDNLEKKYDSGTTVQRSDRKLLFDRMNTAFLEIFRELIDPFPWVKPARRIGLQWQKNGIKDELLMLLACQEKEANEDMMEKVLDREMLWSDLVEDIDVIGKEIEKKLINDLITEAIVSFNHVGFLN